MRRVLFCDVFYTALPNGWHHCALLLSAINYKTVIRCVGHYVNRGVLHDSSVFSMRNLRNVVDRVASGVFFAPPHSPRCTWEVSPVNGIINYYVITS